MSDILSISNNLLSTIYSTSDGTSTVSSDPLGALKAAEANSTKDIAQEAAQPQVARDIATFRAAVASAKTPAALLQNPTVLKVLLTANGLGDQTAYTALAQKALLSNTSVSTSLADQLPNTAWKSAASTLDFANSGLSVIQNTSVLDTIANGYAEVLWRQSLDTTTPGLSNALTFRSEASTITSVDQILADSSLRSVVLTALGIPETIAYQDIGAQEDAISNRLDITQFKDPKFVEQFAQRYLIQNNIADSDSSTNSTNSVLSSYGFASTSSSDSTGTDSATLASLVVKSQGLIV
jgi:hypothetical protein